MKQLFNTYTREDEKGIAGQARNDKVMKSAVTPDLIRGRNDSSFCMKKRCLLTAQKHEDPTLPSLCGEGPGERSFHIKKIIVFIGLWIGINGLQAQEQYSNEWNINLGAGSSTLNYESTIGTRNSATGASFGVGYTCFFSRQWGFTTGLEAGFYNSSFNLNSLHLEYPVAVPAGLQGNFYLHADYDGYEEKQNVTLFQIPVLLQFQAPLGNSFFYLGAGIKIGFPVSATYNQTIRSITTSGYSDYTAVLYENIPEYGFGTFSQVQSSDKLDLSASCLLSLETGIKWKVSGKNSFYTGIYLDYGLNNINKEPTRNFLEYNPASPSDYEYNSILQSKIDNNTGIDKLTPFAFGVRIKMAFGSGNKTGRDKKPPALLGYNK